MKRPYFIVALLVFIVLTAGCTGTTGPTQTGETSSMESLTQGESTTSSQTGGAGTGAGNPGGSVSGIADLLKGVVAQGLSVSENSYSYRAIKLTAPAGKFLYYPYYHYNDEAFLLWDKYVIAYSPYDGNYLSGESDKPEVEPESVEILPAEVKLYYPNPEGDYHLMVGTDEKLRVVGYSDMVDLNSLDMSADKYETLVEYEFDADGLLITGEYDGNDNFHYEFVAWKGNELRIYPYTEDQLDNKEKVQPVVYTFPSKVLSVPLYDSENLYVSTEDGFYIVPKPFSGYAKKAYKVSDSSIFAPVVEWSGDFAIYGNGKLSWVGAGLGEDGVYLREKATTAVSGIVSLYGPYMPGNGILLASFSDGKVGIYGIYSTMYGSDEDKIEAIGWLNLKVPLKALAGDYNPDANRVELMGLSNDDSLYVLSGTPAQGAPPIGGTTETQAGTQTETITETQTSTSTPSSSASLFSKTDDFTSLDRNFWYVGEWVTNREAYNKLEIENGVLVMEVDETDRGPYLLSRSIPVKKGDIVIIERRAYVHYGNEYFQGELKLLQTDDESFNPGGDPWYAWMGSQLFSVMYLHYYYEPSPLYMPTKDGFALVGENWREGNYVTAIAIWDEWFTERIVYDTSTGEVTYYLNGKKVGSVRAAPLTAPYIRVMMHPYGWYTGHEMKVDWIKIEVESG